MRSPADTFTPRGLAEIGLLVALACVLGALERLAVPVSVVPGVRLGLGNLAVLVALWRIGPRAAAVVALGKVLLVGLAFGSLFAPVGWMSLSGAVAAWAAMSSGAALGRCSIVGLSIAGSAAHVVGQLLAAACFLGTTSLLGFAPLLLLASLPTGIAVGLLSRAVVFRLSQPVLSAAGG